MENDYTRIWEGTETVVSILHSQAAVATQILITGKKHSASILVDAGDGCLRDLVDREFIFDNLKGILFTHAHYDHCSGLFGLLSFLTVVCKKKKDLPIYTPSVCVEIERQLHLWRELYENRDLFKVNHYRINPGETKSLSNFIFTAHEAAHPASETTSSVSDGIVQVPPSGERGFLYDMQVGHEKVLICPDSGMDEKLFLHAEGADLALLEATLPSENKRVGHIHMTESEARSVGERASSHILVHRGIKSGYFHKLTDENNKNND
ncbi:MAG: MBL fold metallo-hydrolase [Desulfobacteraceae bacterium]|nr:MBL fold metallo-hydrolase [Desulfobacteraceae bacterium]MBU4055518.1 MBL fold metallo-hydrolase [Pseudomonadota bacterium]